GMGEHAGSFLGPVLAVLLLYALQVDIRTIFYCAFIPAALALLIVLFVKEHQPASGPKTKIVVHPRDFPAVYWKYLLAMAIFSIGNSSNSFLILRTQEIGASVLATILIYAGFNLVAALVSFPLTSLSDRWGRKAVLI